MMTQFLAHEGQDTVIVRGSMHHAIMTVTEFEEWLAYEDCSRGSWQDMGDGAAAYCLIRRRDDSVRCTAVRVEDSVFETVY